jgi:FlgD Ig-like domain
VTRLAQVLFAALVAATLGAFFVTQRLKQSPRLVQTLSITRDYSPHFRFRRAAIRIKLTRRADDATVSILSPDGDVVRRLVRNRHYAKGVPIQLLWNGRDDSGRVVPDGSYRVRVGLRNQGRSVTLVDEIRVDGTPPRPLVRVERPKGATGPLIFPVPGGAPVRFSLVDTPVVGTPIFRVYRTDLPRPRAVARLASGAGAASGTWDGRVSRDAGGPAAPAGTYVIVAQLRDRAGNLGSSFPFARPRKGDPPGGAGVTVRYVTGQAPLTAVRAGQPIPVFVDARRARYSWALRRVGAPATVARGSGRGPLLRPKVPARTPSGVYVLALRAGTHVAHVPLAVTGPGSQRVLLVLPLVTWQGLNPVDDNGDGVPDTLTPDYVGDLGHGPVRVSRPFAFGGQPPGFADLTPLLSTLDRPRQRYDLETDYGAARMSESRFDGYRGVVLAGDERWLEPAFAARLRRYVAGGGRVLSLGTRSLRRQVRVRGGRLVGPTADSAFDVFGSSIAKLNPGSVDLLASKDDIKLFEGTDGSFSGFRGYEVTTAPGTGAQIVAQAQDPAGRPVIVAIRSDKGLVIRTGLSTWTRRMADANVSTLTRRAWALLSQ